MAEPQQDNAERIGITGNFQAHIKSIYCLPFAKEICTATNSEQIWKNLIQECREQEGLTDEEARTEIYVSTVFEARHKVARAMLRRTIEKLAIGRGLEVAAGLAQVGMEFTRDYPHLTYVETDSLEGFADKKSELLKKVLAEQGKSIMPRHHFRNLNALKEENYHPILKEFFPNGESMFIYGEGIIDYWADSQKEVFLGIARDAFTSRPGSRIISPDPSFSKEGLKAMLSHIPGFEKVVGHVVKKTKCDYHALAYPTEADTIAAFGRRKWNASLHSLEELGVKLETPDILDIPREIRGPYLESINRHMKAWVLTPNFS